jgi:cob(I)alamin adenosyltransferase
MSIATRTGDDGTTALMFGRRVSKTHPRVETCGTVDELNVFLGVARASLEEEWLQNELEQTQRELIGLMGELAVAKEDADRYQKAGYSMLEVIALQRLDSGIARMEEGLPKPEGWVLPGQNRSGAQIEMARVACRRAERQVVRLRESGEPVTDLMLSYLNRLADFLWLAARWMEKKS